MEKLKDMNFRKMSTKAIRELCGGAKYLHRDRIRQIAGYENLSSLQKKNTIVRENNTIKDIVNSKKVKSMQLYTTWKKSKTWGSVPHLKAEIIYTDGTRSESNYSTTGCGYDKLSTVVADCMNDYLRYKLFEVSKYRAKKSPYGTTINNIYKCYNNGVGMNSLKEVIKFIGGKIIIDESSNSSDFLLIEFK